MIPAQSVQTENDKQFALVIVGNEKHTIQQNRRILYSK